MSFPTLYPPAGGASHIRESNKIMKIIVGLGNPGEKYKNTRHNFGFMAVDFLREKMGSGNWKFSKKFNAEISKGEEAILAKPQTFMNKSGEAVKKILSFYKAAPADLMILHDDLDIEFGATKKNFASRAAGHNGVQSVIDALGTNEFSRVRLGIGRPPENIPPEDFVLRDFLPEELDKLPEIIKKISA